MKAWTVVVAAASLIFGTLLASPAFSWEIYKNDFQNSRSVAWYFTDIERGTGGRPLEIAAENDNLYLVSRGPWWLDPNHAPPGLGYLHLIAFAYHDRWSLHTSAPGNPLHFGPNATLWMYPRAAPAERQLTIADGALTSGERGKAFNLRDAEFKFRIRIKNLHLPSNAHLYVWFQNWSADRSRAFNYVKLSQPLDAGLRDGEWRDLTVKFNASDDEWKCLGASVVRSRFHGCASSVEEAMKDFWVDLGIVLLVGDSIPPEPIRGEVHLDDMVLTGAKRPD